MNPKVKESLKTVFMLPMALALFLIGAAKRLIFAVFLIGLLLPLIPKGMQENFLRLPIVERASPLFLWLIEYGLHLCLVITFLMILRLHRKINRLQHYQAGQAQILGGFMHYLEISDFRLSPTTERILSFGMRFHKYFKDWIARKLVWGRDYEEIVVGEVFSAALKRGDKVVTLRDDIKSYLAEKPT